MRHAIAPIVIAALLMAAPPRAGQVAPRQGWSVTATHLGYGVLLDRVEAAVQARGMNLVTSASASAGAKGQGITIPGNSVIGVFRNDYARRILAASLAAGIEAPIHFHVTENPDGTATLACKTPSFAFAPCMAEGGPALRDLAAELDGVFAAIAADATR